jgi:kinesin family member 23
VPHVHLYIQKSVFFSQVQNTFLKVFDEFASQKTLFDNVAMPLVEDVLHGKNG